MRSLYSGVAGLKTHQTKMDVIGNNIANVNTVGFKASSVLFKEVLYQTTQSATGANASTGTGGTNARQIGLGSGVAAIKSNMTAQGSAQSTNNPYDLMLNSDSFFIISRDGVNYFTKVGSFDTDEAGNLVTGAGDLVMGWKIDPDNPTQIKKDTVSSLKIESVENKYTEPEMTTKTYLSGNIDRTDPALQSADGATRTVTIYDNLGYKYTAKMKLTMDTTDTSKYYAELVSVTNEDNVNILESGDYSATFGADPAVLKFDKDTGEFVDIDGGNSIQLTITPNGTNGNIFANTESASIDIDFSNVKNYAEKGTSTVTWIRGGSDKTGGGRTKGTLSDVSIGTDGKIYGVYNNGVTKLLGQIAVAQFTNPAGLEAIGGNLYKETQNSGEFDGIGQEVTSSGGSMTQGVLEMSNVDLSAEFTDMIVTQRGFQANSRIITTSDSMLEELVNLKR